jgi:hypothetical protein
MRTCPQFLAIQLLVQVAVVVENATTVVRLQVEHQVQETVDTVEVAVLQTLLVQAVVVVQIVSVLIMTVVQVKQELLLLGSQYHE